MFCFWAGSDQGLVRAHNEDCFAISSSDADAQASSSALIDSGEGWALVADGMGGHVAGEVASLLAVQCLSLLLPGSITEDAVDESIQTTNLALFDAMRQQPNLAGMGTTIAGIHFIGSEAVCFNVGDSRIYLADAGGLRQISEDHVAEGHVLTQCLGGWSTGHLGPAVRTLPLLPSTRFILCTDGLTNMVSDAHIAELIWSPEPAAKLIEAALAGGGADNITVVVIEVS